VPAVDVLAIAPHNEGHPNSTSHSRSLSSVSTSLPPVPSSSSRTRSQQPVFSAQPYLRYQGSQPVSTPIVISRSRLKWARRKSLVIECPLSPLRTQPSQQLLLNYGLFTITERWKLASHIPGDELMIIPSPDGHNRFLLKFMRIDGRSEGFLKG